jgi:hypothetical protein
MKKVLILGAAIAMSVASCDSEDEQRVFDNRGGQELLSFEETSDDLEIEIDATGQLDVIVEVSTLSDVDRTFNVSVVTEESDIAPGSVTVPNSVTIPAGSYEGTLTLNGVDVDGVETTPRPLVLELSAGEDVLFTNQRIAVSVFQVCPVDPDQFVGNYRLTHLSPGTFGGTTFEAQEVITLRNDDQNLQRQFTTDYAPFNAFPDRTYRINLVCNNPIFQEQGTGNGCTVQLFLGPAMAASDNGDYDPADDSSFLFSLTEDTTNDCSAAPTPVTILAEKV